MDRCEYGKYCNLDLTDKFTKELSYTETHVENEYTVMSKSIMLDRYETFENHSISEEDPLNLKRKCKIQTVLGLLDVLENQRHLMLANLYKVKKVCFNCFRAISIIDYYRTKQHEKTLTSSSTFNTPSSNYTSMPKVCTRSSFKTLEIQGVFSTQTINKFQRRLIRRGIEK
jgi:hypothetical protein